MQLLGLQAAHLIELIDPVPTNYLHNPCNWELLSVFVTWTSPAGATAVRGTNTPDTRTLLVRHSPTGDGGNPAPPPAPKKMVRLGFARGFTRKALRWRICCEFTRTHYAAL